MDLSALIEPVTSALTGVRAVPGAVLVVVAREARALDLIEELGFWLGDVEAGRLRRYPQRDALPYERADDDPWDVRARLEAIAALHSAAGPIVVASVEAAAQRALSPAAARRAVSSIGVGDRLAPDELLRRPPAAGF